jgi:electron transfer flavoprotein alpha subunit
MIRRDPRGELAAVTVAQAPRRRIDRAHTGGAVAVEARPAAPPARLQIKNPAFLVFAVADAPGGVLTRHDRQVVGAARVLAGGQAAVALLAAGDEDAGALGADFSAKLPAGGYDPELAAHTVAAAVRRLGPRHVLFPETADGGDLARRVAALLGEPLFDSVEALSATAAIRPAAAGRREWRAAPPRLLSIAADMAAPYHGAPHEAAVLECPPEAPARGISRSETLAVDAADIALDQAGLVIAAGNGVRDFPAFLKLAAALRATPGASRVVCDAGALPRAMQVGASGTVLNADTYIAFGISGAPQHLQGIGQVGRVVAVNTDLHAAMIARASLAIIADAQEIMPALLAAALA